MHRNMLRLSAIKALHIHTLQHANLHWHGSVLRLNWARCRKWQLRLLQLLSHAAAAAVVSAVLIALVVLRISSFRFFSVAG